MESDRERGRVPEAAEPLSSGLLTALTDLGRNSANAIAGAVSSNFASLAQHLSLCDSDKLWSL